MPGPCRPYHGADPAPRALGPVSGHPAARPQPHATCDHPIPNHSHSSGVGVFRRDPSALALALVCGLEYRMRAATGCYSLLLPLRAESKPQATISHYELDGICGFCPLSRYRTQAGLRYYL
jgi:hypothetical protein